MTTAPRIERHLVECDDTQGENGWLAMTDGLRSALIWLIAAFIAVTFLIRIVAALHGIPILDGDANNFSPCIHNLALG